MRVVAISIYVMLVLCGPVLVYMFNSPGFGSLTTRAAELPNCPASSPSSNADVGPQLPYTVVADIGVRCHTVTQPKGGKASDVWSGVSLGHVHS